MRIWSLLLWIGVWAPLLLLMPDREAWVETTSNQPTGTYHMTATVTRLSPQSLQTRKGDYILINQAQYQALRGVEKARLTVLRSSGTNKLASLSPMPEKKKAGLVSLSNDGIAQTSLGTKRIAEGVRPCQAKEVVVQGDAVIRFLCQ